MKSADHMATMERVRKRAEQEYKEAISREASARIHARWAAEELEKAKRAVRECEEGIAGIDASLQALKVSRAW